jgi:hypothetical protein
MEKLVHQDLVATQASRETKAQKEDKGQLVGKEKWD